MLEHSGLKSSRVSLWGISVGTIAALTLCLNLGAALAQELSEEEIEVVEKQIAGEVVVITNNYIVVTSGLDKKGEAALEMPFNITKDVKVEHKKSLSEIKAGDTVTVIYEDRCKKDKDRGIRVISRTAKVVRFVRAAPKESKIEALRSEEVKVPEETRNALPLKRIR